MFDTVFLIIMAKNDFENLGNQYYTFRLDRYFKINNNSTFHKSF